jgi:hypothetical protein
MSRRGKRMSRRGKRMSRRGKRMSRRGKRMSRRAKRMPRRAKRALGRPLEPWRYLTSLGELREAGGLATADRATVDQTAPQARDAPRPGRRDGPARRPQIRGGGKPTDSKEPSLSVLRSFEAGLAGFAGHRSSSRPRDEWIGAPRLRKRDLSPQRSPWHRSGSIFTQSSQRPPRSTRSWCSALPEQHRRAHATSAAATPDRDRRPWVHESVIKY